MEYRIIRLDENPANYATYGTWVNVASFKTREEAEAYVRRASSPTQKLQIETRQS